MSTFWSSFVHELVCVMTLRGATVASEGLRVADKLDALLVRDA